MASASGCPPAASRQVHFAQQFGHRVGGPQGINQQRFLPVRQALLIDAQLFF